MSSDQSLYHIQNIAPFRMWGCICRYGESINYVPGTRSRGDWKLAELNTNSKLWIFQFMFLERNDLDADLNACLVHNVCASFSAWCSTVSGGTMKRWYPRLNDMKDILVIF